MDNLPLTSISRGLPALYLYLPVVRSAKFLLSFATFEDDKRKGEIVSGVCETTTTRREIQESWEERGGQGRRANKVLLYVVSLKFCHTVFIPWFKSSLVAYFLCCSLRRLLTCVVFVMRLES